MKKQITKKSLIDSTMTVTITIKNNIEKYLKLKSKGYKTLWVGNGYMSLYKTTRRIHPKTNKGITTMNEAFESKQIKACEQFARFIHELKMFGTFNDEQTIQFLSESMGLSIAKIEEVIKRAEDFLINILA